MNINNVRQVSDGAINVSYNTNSITSVISGIPSSPALSLTRLGSRSRSPSISGSRSSSPNSSSSNARKQRSQSRHSDSSGATYQFKQTRSSELRRSCSMMTNFPTGSSQAVSEENNNGSRQPNSKVLLRASSNISQSVRSSSKNAYKESAVPSRQSKPKSSNRNSGAPNSTSPAIRDIPITIYSKS